MYGQITGEDPYLTPMRIYPAVHYTMGGLWVDYDLQASIPGLYVTGKRTSPTMVQIGWVPAP
jgi:succinate dehydrogenase / fumarate reductase flavoprotein subunit